MQALWIYQKHIRLPTQIEGIVDQSHIAGIVDQNQRLDHYRDL